MRSPGTGSNVCYMEELTNVEKVHVPEDGKEGRKAGKVEKGKTEAQAKDVVVLIIQSFLFYLNFI